MIIQCKSCEKSFVVPDTAISAGGRLVQCSSCGNKWKQFPIKETSKKDNKLSREKPIIVKQTKKSKPRKKGKLINPYSPEYLQKKHGVKLIDPSSSKINGTNKNRSISPKNSFGFYNSLITLIVFLITIVGILHLSKEIIILNLPYLENYINHLFESLKNINIIIRDFISNY